MEGSQHNPKTPKERFSELRDIILIVSPAFLCISFLFNYFYFFALEIPFEKVPLSTIDYIVSINALIPTISICCISYLLTIAIPNFKHKRIENNIRTRQSLKDEADIITSAIIIIFILVLVSVINLTRPTSIFNLNPFFLSTPFILIFLIIDLKFNFDNFIAKSLIFIIVNFPFVIKSSINLASENYTSSESYNILNNHNITSAKISISGNEYVVMRSFNSGFLLRVPNKKELVFLTVSGQKINFKLPDNFSAIPLNN